MLPPYPRVQLFSGGGSRFGYYLGSYAALCKLSLKPDLIMATCGGSLAALLVNIAPDPYELKAVIQSRELYDVVCASQPLSNSNRIFKPKYFYNAIKRFILSHQSSKLSQLQFNEINNELLNELKHLSMFEIYNEPTWLNALLAIKSSSINNSTHNTTSPDIAIIASRVVTDSTQAHQTRLQEVLFAPNQLAISDSIASAIKCPTNQYAPHRILADIHTVYQWDIKQAVRASMADMYYLSPTYIENIGWCLGGVIDLTPIELACQLGMSVFAETKPIYDKWLATPAIKRVFGFDPNMRMQAIHHYQALFTSQGQKIYWLPFADNSKALAGHHIQKRIKFTTGIIELIHPDYDDFIQQMLSQWHYGYERTKQWLNQVS